MNETKNQNAVDDFLLKLQGKVAISEPCEIGHNYSVKIDGSITSKTEEDNNDGSSTFVYRLEPVLVEAITPLGKTLKAKDVRRISQRLRARVYVYWLNNQIEQDFEEYYQKIGEKIISNFDELMEFVLK